mmetsp:Transcript_21292/g.46208  ORF Transcript_21292/g.46208 Transcript_21292/m.46208 type:complete len:186 (-) Transcript_21292:5-562(-)
MGNMSENNNAYSSSRPSLMVTYFIISSYFFCLCLVAAQEIEIVEDVIVEIMEQLCFIPCENGFTGNEVIPGTECQWFHSCDAGEPINIVECGDALVYNPMNDYCDIAVAVDCPPDPTCTPTLYPTFISTPATESPVSAAVPPPSGMFFILCNDYWLSSSYKIGSCNTCTYIFSPHYPQRKILRQV